METERLQIVNDIKGRLAGKGFQIQQEDLSRPWGGFLVIDESQGKSFASMYIDLPVNFWEESELQINGKILFVAPNKRLSWQYHHRRTEIWQVLEGTVGVVISEDDVEDELKLLTPGDQITIPSGTRHRLVGLDTWGVVAEVWQHNDPHHPSNEEDIVRIQDDFGRDAKPQFESKH
jgi:mannose-6-phosphate isomerase